MQGMTNRMNMIDQDRPRRKFVEPIDSPIPSPAARYPRLPSSAYSGPTIGLRPTPFMDVRHGPQPSYTPLNHHPSTSSSVNQAIQQNLEVEGKMSARQVRFGGRLGLSVSYICTYWRLPAALMAIL